MRSLMKFAAVLSAAVAVSAGQAQAATWILDYAATNGANPAAASLTLDTSDTLNAVGGFDVIAIGGNVDGDAITGLIANPGQPFTSYSADGWFMFDNVLWPTGAPPVSNPGLFFSGASGAEYNFFSDDARTFELFTAWAGVGYGDHSVGTLSITEAPPPRGLAALREGGAVPEPAVWTMMILGFGGIGAVLRRRRGHLSLA